MSGADVPATLSIHEAARTDWDVLVVGAGPAGTLAAHGLARRGARVLLVDRCTFPRDKVCGGCLSAGALAILAGQSLGDLVTALGGAALSELHWHYGRHDVRLRLPGGVAISRRMLDAALVRRAIAAGAAFLPRTTAWLGPVAGARRLAVLGHEGQRQQVSARLALAADGLAGRFLASFADAREHVAPRSWMGLAGLPLQDQPPASSPCAGGVVRMACGPRGYVGMVRAERDRLNVAAAMDPLFVREAGGPLAAAQALLRSAGLVTPRQLEHARWHGTALLTRRRPLLGLERVLVLGDAARYVEPFTGEGIAWAMTSGVDVVDIAAAAVHGWDEDIIQQWAQRQRNLLARRQLACGAIAAALRRPALCAMAIDILRRLPLVGGAMIEVLHAPLSVGTGARPWPRSGSL